jgi:phosphoribosylamine--glycine ligase
VKVLVVGGGGREHALCWALRNDLPSATLYCAPGNPGTAEHAENLPIGSDKIDQIVGAANEFAVDLVVVGPEVPLARGLADKLRAANRPVFGPSAAAARIESSKAFAKEVMLAAGVPTAPSRSFTELAPALAYVDRHEAPLVVKASGLAAGKGAIICASREEARRALTQMLRDGIFGEAGKTAVVESFLEGEEVSVLAVTNGRDLVILPAAQDHKRLEDRDRGPNTGGMGAYSPVSFATREFLDRVERLVLIPTLAEMERRGAPFAGVLYAGLMVDERGNPNVVEFNCRFGDPEAQVILPLIASGFADLLHAVATRTALPKLEIASSAAVTTVLAAAGYPETPRRGDPIAMPRQLPSGTMIFQAGTQRDDAGTLRTNGGRVMAVTGVAPTFAAAQAASRQGAESVVFAGKQFRRDIGWREARRQRV